MEVKVRFGGYVRRSAHSRVLSLTAAAWNFRPRRASDPLRSASVSRSGRPTPALSRDTPSEARRTYRLERRAGRYPRSRRWRRHETPSSCCARCFDICFENGRSYTPKCRLLKNASIFSLESPGFRAARKSASTALDAGKPSEHAGMATTDSATAVQKAATRGITYMAKPNVDLGGGALLLCST